MFSFSLFFIVAVPTFFSWAGYHAFIKGDFASIKSDFYGGLLYLALAGGVFYLLFLA